MRSIVTTTIAVLMATALMAQNVEFDKANFPDKKDAFKTAVKEKKQGDEIFEEASRAGDFGFMLMKNAIPHYEIAQKFNPNNAELNYRLGTCYMHSAFQFKALEHLKKAYELNPTISEEVLFKLGRGYHLHEDWDQAIEAYTKFKAGLDQKKAAETITVVNKFIEECKNGKELVKSPIRVWVDNLGANVNSKYGDYSPVISADESVVIFTSRRDNSTGGKLDDFEHKYYEDVFISEKRLGKWGPAKNIGEAINSENHDATAGLSPDGQTLLVYYGRKNGGDIYVSNRKSGDWTKAESIGKNINTDDHESAASLSADGKKLYYVSDKKEDNLGGHDIFMSEWDEEKERWGEPKNLGPVINTKYEERGVFMHPDGKTLYFSSTGHNTMGGLDIMYSTKQENGAWSEPVNIGYPVNTTGDDVFFVVSASGRHAYFSSYKKGGYGDKDIYKITFLGPEKPPLLSNEDNLLASLTEPVKEIVVEPKVEVNASRLAILKGMIRDAKTLKPVEAKIELMDNEANDMVAQFTSNAASGKFLVTLPAGKNYGIAVKADGYLFHSENFNVPDDATYVEYEKNVDLKRIEIGSTIVLRNIFFDFDKYTLRDESQAELERLTKLMNDNPTLKIEISGHTDSKGSDSYNETLSGNRAKAVVTYLIKNGIDKDRLEFKGYGEKKPIATNDTDEGRQLNRRTEFKILAM